MSETVTDDGAAVAEQQSAPIADSPTETQTESRSIRDTLGEAFDAAQERDDEAREASRDDAGRFAKKEASPSQPAAEKVAPPDGWEAPAGVDWNRLPRTVQEALRAREDQVRATMAEAEPLKAVVQQYASAFQARGVAPVEGLQGLLSTYAALEQNPSQTLQWLAERYGLAVVDPRTQAQQAKPATDEWVDPQVESLRKELADVKAFMTQAQQASYQQQQAAVQRLQTDLLSEVEAFRKDRPHFDAVRHDMAILVREGRAKDLAEAYEMATWMNPQTRAALADEQRKTEEAERAKRAKEAARAAQVNVRSSTGATPRSPKSIRESLEQSYDAINAA